MLFLPCYILTKFPFITYSLLNAGKKGFKLLAEQQAIFFFRPSLLAIVFHYEPFFLASRPLQLHITEPQWLLRVMFTMHCVSAVGHGGVHGAGRAQTPWGGVCHLQVRLCPHTFLHILHSKQPRFAKLPFLASNPVFFIFSHLNVHILSLLWRPPLNPDLCLTA